MLRISPYYHVYSIACSSISSLQEQETEYNLMTMIEKSSAVSRADSSQFELLKVLGQGSFGKVCFVCIINEIFVATLLFYGYILSTVL